MASSSSLRSKNRWNYDVFLSFRGPDTRDTFTGHLHHELHSKGINVFIDNELQRGELITSQLFRIIEESRVSIVILSENYASSSFCLDELEKILESRLSKGQTVIPVFYHIDPTDVEEQRGTFGEEFAKLEAQLNNHLNSWKLFPSIAASIAASFLRNVTLMWPTVDNLDEQRNNDEETSENIMQRVQKWRLALTEVARLSGWHLKKGDHESKIIQDIMKEAWKKLDYTPLQVADHPVGIASRVKYIVQRLNMKSHDVCMLGLHGMGGVGKTTIARALYNIYACEFKFEGSCFLSKVRENTKKRGIAKLQQILLSKILRDQGYLIENSEEGIELIKRRLQSKKVFIVIDDVDHIKQLQQLAGGLEWFGKGSIIIITTRNLHLLEQHRVTMIHEIKELEFDEALKLFSWYAFKEPQPDEAYYELSRHVIRYTRGLPLALIVLGSSLYNGSAPIWDDMLKKLKRVPNEMDEVLKVSFDSLDSEEKAIFLDIAFFFKGKDKIEVTKFLDECGFGAHLGIERLIQNSLVYVDSYGRLQMHDLLEAMGSKISLEESFRLCIRGIEDIHRLFVKDKAYDVEILVLDLNEEEEVPLKWLQNLTKLRALIFLNGRFIKMSKKFPNSIRWLEWDKNCSTSIPSRFLPPNLVVLRMSSSNTKKFLIDMPKAQKFMNLIRIDFKSSEHLREMVIDFSSIPNIEVLDLRDCAQLKKIHKSVGRLKNLKELKFGGCRSLTSLPNLVDNECLQLIDLMNCSNLENLPNLPPTITNLFLLNTGIKEIPLFIGNLINLKYLQVSNCKNLKLVSNSIFKLLPKISVSLYNCPNLSQLPEAESCMLSPNPTSLTENWLDLSKNKFVSLPVNTFKFIHITNLTLNDCEWLVEIPELPHTLWCLEARNCKSLVRFSQFQFEYLFKGVFVNCHKILGENERKSWREMVGTKKDSPWWWRYHIIVPGNEVPEWFSYVIKRECDIPSFHPSFQASTDNLFGIVWCVIFQYPHSLKSFEVTLKIDNFSLETLSLRVPLESGHMWLGFGIGLDSFLFPKDNSSSFEFDFFDAEADFFRDFGVHFMYKN